MHDETIAGLMARIHRYASIQAQKRLDKEPHHLCHNPLCVENRETLRQVLYSFRRYWGEGLEYYGSKLLSPKLRQLLRSSSHYTLGWTPLPSEGEHFLLCRTVSASLLRAVFPEDPEMAQLQEQCMLVLELDTQTPLPSADNYGEMKLQPEEGKKQQAGLFFRERPMDGTKN